MSIVVSWTNIPKPSLKIKTANAIFWINLGIFRHHSLKSIFLGWKAVTFSICFMKPQKISAHSDNFYFHFSINCMIDLKLCEVSWNFFSNRCWKFQLSIFKNKKVLFLKKIFFGPYRQGVSIFQKVLINAWRTKVHYVPVRQTWARKLTKLPVTKWTKTNGKEMTLTKN